MSSSPRLSWYDGQTVAPEPGERAARQLEEVAKLILEGHGPSGIARKLKVGYPRAAKLHDQVYARVWERVQEDYTPDVLQAMKREMSDTLAEEIATCREAVAKSGDADKGPNTRPYGHMNVAIKLLSAMHGFNAPTQIETTDRKLYALVNPAMHARIMADPRARENLIALEEFASGQFIEGQVIDIGQPEGGDS